MSPLSPAGTDLMSDVTDAGHDGQDPGTRGPGTRVSPFINYYPPVSLTAQADPVWSDQDL